MPGQNNVWQKNRVQHGATLQEDTAVDSCAQFTTAIGRRTRAERFAMKIILDGHRAAAA